MGMVRVPRAAAILLAVGIAIALRLRVSHLGRAWHLAGGLHTATHVLLFALLAALLMLSSTSRRHRWLSFAAVVLLGLGTEYYEHLRDGYPIETDDVLADAAGAALALVILTALPPPAPRSTSRL